MVQSNDVKSKNVKKKYKKDALEEVNYEEELKKDPKYKTELCRTFSETKFCKYGNKCRFAHGKEELNNKNASHPKFRKNDCLTFHTNGFCNYGQRCHFRHHESRQLQDISRSYYSLKLNFFSEKKSKVENRLPIFKEICDTDYSRAEKTPNVFPQNLKSVFNPNFNQFYFKFANNLKRIITFDDNLEYNENMKTKTNDFIFSTPTSKISRNHSKVSNLRTSANSKIISPSSIDSRSPNESFAHPKFLHSVHQAKKLDFFNIDNDDFFQ